MDCCSTVFSADRQLVTVRASLKPHHKGAGLLRRMYQKLLTVVLQHRALTLTAALAVLLVAGFGATRMQGEFFPSSDRPELLVSLTLLPMLPSLKRFARQRGWKMRSRVIKTSTTIQLT